MVHTTPCWVESISICYEEEPQMGNDSKKKQHFLQYKRKQINNKEAYTDELKSKGSKVGFAAVFANITRWGALVE